MLDYEVLANMRATATFKSGAAAQLTGANILDAIIYLLEGATLASVQTTLRAFALVQQLADGGRVSVRGAGDVVVVFTLEGAL